MRQCNKHPHMRNIEYQVNYTPSVRRRPTLRLVSLKTSHHFKSQFQSTILPVYTVQSSRHFNFSPHMHILFLCFKKHAMEQPCIWLRINSVNYYPPNFLKKFYLFIYNFLIIFFWKKIFYFCFYFLLWNKEFQGHLQRPQLL